MKLRAIRQGIVLSARFVQNKNISFGAKGLYAYLLSMADLSNIRIAVVSMTMLEPEDRIKGYFAELWGAGFIEEMPADYDTAASRVIGMVDGGLVEPIFSPVNTREDKRDPFVTETVEYFKKANGIDFGLARQPYQRRAAKTIIQWTKGDMAKVRSLIDMAAKVQGQQYAPVVLSVEDLRDKCLKVIDFYRRTHNGADAQLLSDIERMVA